MENSDKKFVITCLSEGSIHVLESFCSEANNYNKSFFSKINNLIFSKKVLNEDNEKFDYLKKTFLYIIELSTKYPELSTSLLFENKKLTNEELELLQITNDFFITDTHILDVLRNKESLFIDINQIVSPQMKKNTLRL